MNISDKQAGSPLQLPSLVCPRGHVSLARAHASLRLEMTQTSLFLICIRRGERNAISFASLRAM